VTSSTCIRTWVVEALGGPLSIPVRDLVLTKLFDRRDIDRREIDRREIDFLVDMARGIMITGCDFHSRLVRVF
jgi:hypothetical protein